MISWWTRFGLVEFFSKMKVGTKLYSNLLDIIKNGYKTIGNSPELKEAAAMFAPVLQQQAVKIVPQIDATVSKIQDALSDSIPVDSLADDVPLIQKALECYQSDIEKAETTGHEYFQKLLGDIPKAKQDSANIAQAIDKIKQVSA